MNDSKTLDYNDVLDAMAAAHRVDTLGHENYYELSEDVKRIQRKRMAPILSAALPLILSTFEANGPMLTDSESLVSQMRVSGELPQERTRGVEWGGKP